MTRTDQPAVASYSRALIASGLACVSLAGAGAAGADTLPLPKIDFALAGRTLGDNATVKMAHREGRIRLEIDVAGMPGGMTAFINPQRRRMIMLSDVPGMQNMAVEVELPEQYAFAGMPISGTRLGTDTVAGEACEVWRAAEKSEAGPVDACITADGIVLRTQATVRGKPQVVFEATEISRAPQDPKRFELPPGVKVTRMPKGMQSLLPGLGLGR
ncbi:hypothetical protein [Ancylobacter terrae]|uniref:hypothetical protein n=1 Tax=Ancylobacter sp. sgz301288 TaxID=3342077 RepID=UPI00385C3470